MKKVIANALSISAIGYLIFLLFYPILSAFNFLGNNLKYLYILLLLQGLNQIFAQYTRGIGESTKFALNGIITTFFTGMFNVIFLVYLNRGLDGYFLAYIFGYLISVLYLLISTQPLKGVRFSDLDKDISTTFLRYSIPLIPNSLMWWLINSSSRYFINWFVGIEANGLFAVSSKIPALINIISQVFSQAWQLSAFEEYENSESAKFYSNVFDLYFSVLLLTTSAIILVIKPVFSLLFADSYFDAWQPVPFLLLGTTFSAASGFIGVAYTASKKTSGVFRTSIYGGIISLILNLIFIPTLGIIGAGISSMVSFFAMFIIRYFDTKDLISIKINWRKIFSTLLLIGIQIFVIFLGLEARIELIINSLILLLILIVNRNLFDYIIKMYHAIRSREK
ncbi:lipopolysaccharide biosynthesis protein [Ruoffia tabacinasalis]|uniref:lipopolysaccharide biosynthesis protein n=1 Tax=Ruoffia tabacinasalis TaxID=87458 RepID=UPI0030D0A103